MLAVGPATMVLKSRTRIPWSTGAKQTKIAWGAARKRAVPLAGALPVARAGLGVGLVRS
jgi:hypothetical protein